jgi:hypothetical protein
MERLTPEDLQDIFGRLQGAGLETVIVGGQAINLWAVQYGQATEEWDQFRPFASEDLDCYGGRIEVMTCRDALNGRATFNRDFDPSPNAGVVLVDRQGATFRIDILTSVFGLSDGEIVSTSQRFVGQGLLGGLVLNVLNPVLCLEGKLRCLQGLPQAGRQDEKHVRLSTLIVREFLSEQLPVVNPRTGLNLVERVVRNAWSESGLYAWYHYGIEVKAAVPIELIQSLSEAQWQQFCQIRMPQIAEQLRKRQEQYQQVMAQIEQRQAQKQSSQES